MAIEVGEFTPSVTILGTDKISYTDDKLRTIMGEAKTFLEANTQSAVDQVDAELNDRVNVLINTTINNAFVQVNSAKAETLQARDETITAINEAAIYNPTTLERRVKAEMFGIQLF